MRVLAIATLASLLLVSGCGGDSGSSSSSAPTSPAPVTPTPPPADPTAVLGASNFRSGSLPFWRAARATVLAGQMRGKIACIGDSTTAGVGSGGGDFVNAKVLAWPKQFADLLTAQKLPAHASSFFGDAGFLGSLFAGDPRLSETPAGKHDWVVSTAYPTIGGYDVVNITSKSTLTFTPADPFDTVDIYDVAASARATFVVGFDKGAPALTVTTPAVTDTSVRLSTAHVTLGQHAIDIAATEVGPTFAGVFLTAIDAYDASHKDVAVWNMGWAGSQTIDWVPANTPYAPMTMLARLRPDLSIINLGINDMGQKVTVDGYKARVRTIIDTALKSCDVILVIPNRIDPSNVTDATQDAYAQALTDLSKEANVPLFDIGKVLGSFKAAKAAGYMTDGVHPSATGYAVIAKGLSQMALIP